MIAFQSSNKYPICCIELLKSCNTLYTSTIPIWILFIRAKSYRFHLNFFHLQFFDISNQIVALFHQCSTKLYHNYLQSNLQVNHLCKLSSNSSCLSSSTNTVSLSKDVATSTQISLHNIHFQINIPK